MIWNLDPFRELERMRRDMDSLFQRAGFPGAGYTSFPAMNLYDSDEESVVLVELPGVPKEAIHLDVRDNVLIVSGKRETPEPGGKAVLLRDERPEGEFRKSFRLPAKVQADKVQATHKNGILTVRLPKAEEAKPRQIAIQA